MEKSFLDISHVSNNGMLTVKEWQQLWNQCTSNFTVCNRWLVAVSVRHSPLWLSPYQQSSNWSYKTYKLLSPKGRESTGMWSLPFSTHSQAHLGRLHPSQCRSSDILWSGHTQGRFWKCCIAQHHRLC